MKITAEMIAKTLYQPIAEAQELDAVTKQNLRGLGYGE